METILLAARRFEESLRDKGLLPEPQAAEPVQIKGIAALHYMPRMPSDAELERRIKKLQSERA